jgi:hypothetical protein
MRKTAHTVLKEQLKYIMPFWLAPIIGILFQIVADTKLNDNIKISLGVLWLLYCFISFVYAVRRVKNTNIFFIYVLLPATLIWIVCVLFYKYMF